MTMNAPIQITEPNTPQVAADQIDFVDLYRRWEQGNWSAMDIDFTQDKEVLKIGELSASVQQEKTVPQWAGGAGVLIGLGLLVAGAMRKR